MNTQAVVASIDRDIAKKRWKIEQDLTSGISRVVSRSIASEKRTATSSA